MKKSFYLKVGLAIGIVSVVLSLCIYVIVDKSGTEKDSFSALEESGISEISSGLNKDEVEIMYDLMTQQSVLIKLFHSKLPDKDEDKSRYIGALISFLGPGDFIAQDVSSVFEFDRRNLLYGYAFGSVGVDSDKGYAEILRPLTFGLNLDMTRLKQKNTEGLLLLKDFMLARTGLQVVGYREESNVMRINDLFVAIDQSIYRSLNQKSGYVYTFNTGDIRGGDGYKNIINRYMSQQDIMGLKKVMKALGVSVIYQCNPTTTIYVSKQMGDNGFGFLASDSKDNIHCGLLNKRFNILRSELIAPGVWFWVGG